MKKIFFKKNIFGWLLFILLFSLPILAQAADDSSGFSVDDANKYRPNITVEIGGFNSSGFGQLQPVSCPSNIQADNCVKIDWLAKYIKVIYQYGVGLAALLSAVMIMVGGFLWLTSAGNPTRIGRAKEFITGAIIGLLLALFSYLILYTINPALVQNQPITVPITVPLHNYCCKQADGSYAYETTQEANKCSTGETPEGNEKCDNCCCQYETVGCTPKDCTVPSACTDTQYPSATFRKVGCGQLKLSKNFGICENKSTATPDQSKCCCVNDFYLCTPSKCESGYCPTKSGGIGSGAIRWTMSPKSCAELNDTMKKACSEYTGGR